MWLRILPMIMVFSGFCNGNKNFSCDFYYTWCGWYTSSAGNCDWKKNEENFHGDLGYIFLKADFNCHSRIQYAFKMWDNSDTNYLNFEYYVLGPGPFTLSVSNDVEDYKVNWGCRIQPGRQRREAHVKVTGNAVYININGNVSPGSSIIITRIWSGNKGDKMQHVCPQNTTTPSPTTRLTTSTIMPTTFKTTNNSIPTLPSFSTFSSRPGFVSSKTRISVKYDTSSTGMRFITTPSVTRMTRMTETSENVSGERWTQKPNPTFSAIDNRTKPSSDITSKKMPTNQPKSTLVMNLVTGSNHTSGNFDAKTGADKGKATTGVVVGAVISSIVLAVLFASIIFFLKKKRKYRKHVLKPILKEQEQISIS